ncbi:MAG: hypothetical protein ABIF19_11105 [Planctomycetota bacterium]
MIKRTLIAIAVVALMASAVQAAGPDPHFFDNTAIKVNIENIEIGWPYEYKALTICTMPVYMNVGYFVQLKDCSDRKIELKQVDCGDIGKGADDWPCYFDCETIKVRANFEVKLGTDLTKVGPVIDGWSAYYDGGSVVPGDGAYHEMKVCVKAWKAKLMNSAPGSKVKVGELHITVKPNV